MLRSAFESLSSVTPLPGPAPIRCTLPAAAVASPADADPDAVVFVPRRLMTRWPADATRWGREMRRRRSAAGAHGARVVATALMLGAA